MAVNTQSRVSHGKHIRLFLCLVLCLLASLTSANAVAAEQKFGDYIVHYNAFASDFLSPEIATHYGITRSRNLAILNISVQQKTPDGKRVAVAANVTAEATNLFQKLTALDLRQVNDGDAIYHLAEFKINNGQNIDFQITLSIAEQSIGTINFKQQFFTD